MNRYNIALCIIMGSLSACNSSTDQHINLDDQQWIHGSVDCGVNEDPAIQVVRYNKNTWILRQNKCSNYEAPFMFLFLGEDKALLMDTGATTDSTIFPIYDTVKNIIDDWEKEQEHTIDLVVTHTHSHGDHFAGDNQFKGKPNTQVIGLKTNDVKEFFGVRNWPSEIANFDLGNRVLNIIPIPGHQSASIAVFDTSSRILLTGDTFYPGRLYVQNWVDFKHSIQRLVDFTDQHEVSYILGNHIEMSTTAGVDYPIRTTYQPEEHKLPLTIEGLHLLNEALKNLGDTPKRETLDSFIIYPN